MTIGNGHNPDRIYLEPDHAQIEGRMWCQDDDPASLGEPWTEYVRADIHAARTAELANMREEREEHFVALVKSARRIATLTAERNRYREELENIANADQSTWDEDMRDPMEFKRWAQSRARHALNREE